MSDSAGTQKKMLITGVSGLLGNNLAYYFMDSYKILGLYNSHPVTIEGLKTAKCNLLYLDSIKKVISEYKPNILIHCAALTNVDKCEEDRNAAKKMNVIATKNIIRGMNNGDAYLIYISTDSVYDGVRGNYSENDKINPQNYYGLSKYKGELETSKHENSLILRTNIFGWNIQNKRGLAEWILEKLKAGHRINGFKDVFFSPIYTMELARVIDISIKKNVTGVFNCGSVDSCSKYEFACKIADRFSLNKTLITPTSIGEHNFEAKRGRNLTLNVDKIQKVLGYQLSTINGSINSFYGDYKNATSPKKEKQHLSNILIHNF